MKSDTYTSSCVLIGGRVLAWSYERILGWMGGVRKFLSLKELRNPYAKMDHPLGQYMSIKNLQGAKRTQTQVPPKAIIFNY